MSRADRLKATVSPESGDVDDIEGMTIVCKRCFTQVDNIRYNFDLHLLFWECPNGHRDFIEDFEL